MSEKVISSLTASAERRLLLWFAHRLPAWVTPNMLTLFGAIGGALCFLGYGLSGLSQHWIWLACIGIVFHWFGDSLDGTVARVRHIERPKFGMFLDQTVDIATVILIFAGLGLSPWVRLEVACFFIIGYLMLVALTHLRSNVTGTYDIAYGWLGPTEGRIILLFMTLLMLLIAPYEMTSWPFPMTSFDHIFLIMAAWTVVSYAIASWKVLGDLAKEEPPRRPSEGRGTQSEQLRQWGSAAE
jgi:archaetidylinositol phosphate synthase